MQLLDFVNGSRNSAIDRVPAFKVQEILNMVMPCKAALDQVVRLLKLVKDKPTKIVHLRFRDGMFAGWKQLTQYEVGDIHNIEHTIMFEEIDLEYNLENEDGDLSCVFELC